MVRKRPVAVLSSLLLLTLALSLLPAMLPGGTAHAETSALHLRVVSARTVNVTAPTAVHINEGDVLTAPYKWMITRDDTGDPSQPATPQCQPYHPTDNPPSGDPDYPANCAWPSIHAVTGGAGGVDNLVSQGDNTALNETQGIDLPPGKYLISVMSQCPITPTQPCAGYKIDGEHFSVPLPDPGLVTVHAQPLPLPLATLRVKVFEDVSTTNGEFDDPEEHGLAGFQAHLDDIMGEVTTDWYGNPLCTQYQKDANGAYLFDEDGKPIPIDGSGGRCLSDANGDVVIPNLGPNRYEVRVVPPAGQDWSLTSTLEGGMFWDEWISEGYTGYSTEALLNGSAMSAAQIGFVHPLALPNNPAVTGEIKGTAVGIKTYVPSRGGIPFEGLAGNKIDTPIDRPWIALGDLRNNDTTIYVGRGNSDGTFDIKNVPDGDYSVSVWDDDLNYLVQVENATVANGQVTDMGNYLLAHWWSIVEGTVFIDSNANGKRDPGEQGVPNLALTLKSRDNSLQDQGTRLVTTDANGHYIFRQAYPLGQWVVEEMYNERFYTTGVTYQTDNQPEETTFLGSGVDISTFNLVSLSTRVDWGIKPYAPGTNGGIVGEVVYDVTRNELDPRFGAAEDYQPGIPGLNVHLYAPIACGTHTGTPCGPGSGGKSWELAPDGSYAKGPELNDPYVSETWQRPTDCVARDVNGEPVVQDVLPAPTGGHDCLEAPLMSNQVQTGFSTVNGNYGFTTIKADPVSGAAIPEAPLPAGDYLVAVEVPNDASGHPAYNVTREEDVNVFNGDQFVPQAPPPPCAGPLHIVDVQGSGDDGPAAVSNPGFAQAGGSPFEGQQRPLCNMKLVTVTNGRSVTPNFTFFTDVPLPGRVFGLLVDDLNVSANPQELNYGELAGIPNAPVGIYDFSGRLVMTAHSDRNGYFEALLPSTSTYNCPLPAGPCPNMYRFVGNDPGQPGHLNADYNPQYRTIAAIFQVWPGITLPVDVAPTTVAVAVEGPGTQNLHPAECRLDPATPQLFTVSKPYVSLPATTIGRTFTINGQGFGATQGSGKVTLNSLALGIVSWSDRQIVAQVPGTAPPGAYQLKIVAGNGQSTVNGLTFHVLGTGYAPTVFEVGPGKTYATIQSALEAAASRARALVVVYPGTPDATNPFGAYYENLVMHSPVKLQGVGPGGFASDGTYVAGSVVDGLGFNSVPGKATTWRTLVGGLTWSGNQEVYDGEVIYVLARDGQFTAGYAAAVDGLTIQGGDQLDFPGNLNDRGGGPVPNPVGDIGIGITQGGGIFANAYARYLQITNNVLKGNSGQYGGAIRIGTPYVGDNHNDNVHIAYNRILANGGTSLAGAIGLFTGSTNYEVDHNDVCGNFSAEYGGGVSHFGLSPNGKIHHNRIYFNGSYDEGAGVMIAGELPPNATTLSQGSGPVDVYANLIQANIANDDGGGLRFLQAGNFPINVVNNTIVNNVSTHEGGGVALDDATNVRVYNNTIMKNLTTATAATSNGQPMPAGISDTGNSVLLQATLPAGAATWSNPLLFNNILWDNRAGSWDGNLLHGIGLPGDPSPPNLWDLGLADGAGILNPTNSILQTCDAARGCTPDPSNKLGQDPLIKTSYDTSILAMPWRGDPHFVGTITIALDVPPNLMGNYHLQGTSSPANNAGAASKLDAQAPTQVNAPASDSDGDVRPSTGGYEIGADEIPGVPNTVVLDTFNRANGPVGANWTDPLRAFTVVQTDTVRSLGAAQVNGLGGAMYWNPPGGSGLFGANQEAFFTFNRVATALLSTDQDLLLKLDPTPNNGHMLMVRYSAALHRVTVLTGRLNPLNLTLQATFTGVTFNNGDTFAARALADGTVDVYKNGTRIGTVNVVSRGWPAAYAAAPGYTGVMFMGVGISGARFDDFGGGTLP